MSGFSSPLRMMRMPCRFQSGPQVGPYRARIRRFCHSLVGHLRPSSLLSFSLAPLSLNWLHAKPERLCSHRKGYRGPSPLAPGTSQLRLLFSRSLAVSESLQRIKYELPVSLGLALAETRNAPDVL